MLVVLAAQTDRLEAGLAEHGHRSPPGIEEFEVGGEGVRRALAHAGMGKHRHVAVGKQLDAPDTDRHEGHAVARDTLGICLLGEQRDKQLEGAVQDAGMQLQGLLGVADLRGWLDGAEDAVTLYPGPGNRLKGGAVVQPQPLGLGKMLRQGDVRVPGG